MVRAALAPTLDWERWLWQRGYRLVAGVDEAGRGALAGPLVAAAVVLPPDTPLPAELAPLRDSKALSPELRERLAAAIAACALAIGVAVVPADLIDAVGIAAAGQLALARAVSALSVTPAALLTDAFRIRAVPQPQIALVQGDARCCSVAAASVIAKVTRDRLMCALHLDYPAYGFDRHKGYGTAAHQAALRRHGPCALHRRSFAPVRDVCLR
ncbi:MAG TPA: ribonuclease HII [Chloroflexota bacterium]|nr:ribonuclease HII [Chloroflexota bacterium]